MDYLDLVTSLECEATEHRDSRAGELLAQAAEAITMLCNRVQQLELEAGENGSSVRVEPLSPGTRT
jgi:hypothetical protein